MREMETDNRHLKELINNLKERVAEQALTIKAFITRLIPS